MDYAKLSMISRLRMDINSIFHGFAIQIETVPELYDIKTARKPCTILSVQGVVHELYEFARLTACCSAAKCAVFPRP